MNSKISELPFGLQQLLDNLTPKARRAKLWPVIVWLCALRAYTHPEVVNHPEQAYRVTAKGLSWLKQQGICVDDPPPSH